MTLRTQTNFARFETHTSKEYGTKKEVPVYRMTKTYLTKAERLAEEAHTEDLKKQFAMKYGMAVEDLAVK